MAQRLLAKTARFGILQQTATGTPPTAWDNLTTVSSAFKSILNNAKSTVPNYNVNISGFDYLSSNGLLQEANRQYVDEYSSLKTLNFSGYAYKESIADELKAIFQQVQTYTTYSAEFVDGDNEVTISGSMNGLATGQTITATGITFDGKSSTTITSVNTSLGFITLSEAADQTSNTILTVTDSPKEFTINNNLLDFKAGDGYLYGVAYQTYNGTGAGDGVLLHNALLDEYTLSINNEGTGVEKLLKKEGTWIGNKMVNNLDFTGSWVAIPTTPTYYKHANLSLTVNGTAYNNICWKNFSIKINRNITPICLVNGIPTNYLTQPTIEVTIDIPYTDTTYQIFSAYKTGANVEFILLFAEDVILNAYHGNNFAIQGNSGILKSNPYQYDGEYLALRLEFDVTKPSGTLIPTIVGAGL